MPCPEPGCGGTLRLLHSRHKGWYYGCDQFKKTRCHGTVGAHADGRPMGIPAPHDTKVSRQIAHKFFDRLWQRWPMSRPDAYELIGKRMGVEDLHIGELDEEGCDRLIEHVQDEISMLKGLTSSFDRVDEELVELEGPFECDICGGHLMVDVTFLDKVSWRITCPYCKQHGKVRAS